MDETACCATVERFEQGHFDVQRMPGGVALRVFLGEDKVRIHLTWAAAEHLAHELAAAFQFRPRE